MTAEDRWLAALILLLAVLGAVLVGVNGLYFHFTGISYFPRQSVALLFPAIELAAFGVLTRESSPKAAFIARSGGYYVLLAMAISILVTGIQFTPCAPIDARLPAWDGALGWDVAAVMRWTCARPALRRALEAAYAGLNVELFTIPFLATYWGDRRRARVFLFAMGYASLAGCLFYYAFPSSGPATVVASPFFTGEQRLTSWKFRQVHSMGEVTTIQGGMIALPSMHAVWALLLSYAAGVRRGLFYPAAVFNLLVLLSTVLLGWHFLVDILASGGLAAAAWAAAAVTDRRLAGIEKSAL